MRRPSLPLLSFFAAATITLSTIAVGWSLLARVAAPERDRIRDRWLRFLGAVVAQSPQREREEVEKFSHAVTGDFPYEFRLIETAKDRNVAAPGDGNELAPGQSRWDRTGGGTEIGVIRLPGSPPRFLQVSPRVTTPSGLRRVTAAILFVLCGVIGISLGLSFGLALAYLRSRARSARAILAHLRGGDLSARFRAHRLDQFGELMLEFNAMADEIERLVNRLRRNEKIRVELLQDLGHDLRTPFTSMQNVLDALRRNRVSLPENDREKAHHLLNQELSYMKRLLEDLFLLAQMTEPDYGSAPRASVALGAVLASLVERLNESLAPRRPVELRRSGDWGGSWEVRGDEKLLERLFTNAVGNAAKHAKSWIEINLRRESQGEIRVAIRDDGVGFSSQDLEHFGQRRPRTVDPGVDADVSVGLGSQIMVSIAHRHRGRVIAGNWRNGAGEVGGAEVVILLPSEKESAVANG